MADYWVLTQQALQSAEGPLVTKPKLTDKLLSKPPFRFLHDVISAVQASTGFAAGLFNGQELDAHSLQDKEAKVAYLNKIIAVVSMELNQPVPAHPLKIVAGLEPENTNIFLQMLAAAARQGPAADSVQSVLAQYPPALSSGDAAAAPAPPPEQAPAPPPPRQQQQQQPAAEPPAQQQQQQQSVRRKSDQEERPSSRGVSRQQATAAPPPPQAAAPPMQPAPAAAPSAGGGRPQSAKKAPPKTATADSGPARPGARPGAAGGILQQDRGGGANASKPITIFEESKGGKGGGLEDEDDVPVVVAAAAGRGVGGVEGAQGQGVLVQDIMAMQQQLKAAGGEAAEGGEDASEGTGIILKRTAKPATAAAGGHLKDVSGLRDTVQDLCQSALPLSRSVEHLQDDLDTLAKEYKFWLTERRMYQARLSEEQQAAQDLSSLERRLADKDTAIRAARERLAALKAQVLREDEAIMKLLNMVLSAG